jgi:hypothetical protein
MDADLAQHANSQTTLTITPAAFENKAGAVTSIKSYTLQVATHQSNKWAYNKLQTLHYYKQRKK